MKKGEKEKKGEEKNTPKNCSLWARIKKLSMSTFWWMGTPFSPYLVYT
jgi:hypothetical protein